MEFQTADLCDENMDTIRVADPLFHSFGAKKCFGGRIHTVKVHEDNVFVKEILATQGNGKVLVVDGGGSLRCALVGDIIAQSAADNGWEGVIVYGCIRDSGVIESIDIGIKALATHPLKSIKHGRGDKQLSVTFAGVTFTPDEYVYADADGIILSKTPLL